MARKVRDIIRSKMTVLRFLHSEDMAEAYFQNVCSSAYRYANGELEQHHPYSFMKMVSYYQAIKGWEIKHGLLKDQVWNTRDSKPKE